MLNTGLIMYDTDTWLVLRDNPASPAAVISRITDTGGAERYLLLKWELDPAARRMVGIYTSLREAGDAVPWAKRHTPDGNGYPPGSKQRRDARQRLAEHSPTRTNDTPSAPPGGRTS
ncbi:hypothetical protein EDF62_2323 [Leucobacter luti]|uniref:Uncharacterized protein n=1 Tax=Leucobacter luti TaxID=340320 RepID=A0A4R6RXX3_9MICO|nr:hypothetical protein [Leucobacter luti]TDP91704.1 hypothetical protein EDF62_2323 [Leucobacter luti]